MSTSRPKAAARAMVALMGAFALSTMPPRVALASPPDSEEPATSETEHEAAGEPASTPDPSSAAADEQKAKALAQAGRELFWQEEYEAAAKAFLAAYAAYPDPNLLYNLSAAYEKLERYDEALEALDRYAKHAPASEQGAIEAKRREIVQAQRAAEASSVAESPEDPTGTTAPEGSSGPAEGPAEGPAGPDIDAPPSPPVMGPVGWTLASISVVSLGVGIGFGVSASGKSSAAEGDCQRVDGKLRCPASAEAQLDDARTHALVADVMLGVGAAAGVATLAWLGTRLAKRKRSSRQPTVSATTGGIRLAF